LTILELWRLPPASAVAVPRHHNSKIATGSGSAYRVRALSPKGPSGAGTPPLALGHIRSPRVAGSGGYSAETSRADTEPPTGIHRPGGIHPATGVLTAETVSPARYRDGNPCKADLNLR
jgi:hypothetical protein